MVSSRPLISSSSSPYTNSLMTIPSTLITCGIIDTFMFYSFFNTLARSRYLSLFSLYFNLPWGQLERWSPQFARLSFLFFTVPSVCVLRISFVLLGWFWRWKVAVPQLFYGVLFPGFLQDCILAEFFVSVHVVHTCSSNSTATPRKKYHFILSNRLNFHMTDNQSIAVHTFARHLPTSISVNEIFLPKYLNLSNNFRNLSFREETV